MSNDGENTLIDLRDFIPTINYLSKDDLDNLRNGCVAGVIESIRADLTTEGLELIQNEDSCTDRMIIRHLFAILMKELDIKKSGIRTRKIRV